MKREWINPAMNSQENWYRMEIETNHHLMPLSRAEKIRKEAQVMLFESFHNSRHRIFGNGTPIEQIYKVLSVNDPILKERFKREMEDMLRDDNYVYRNWLRTKKR